MAQDMYQYENDKYSKYPINHWQVNDQTEEHHYTIFVIHVVNGLSP